MSVAFLDYGQPAKRFARLADIPATLFHSPDDASPVHCLAGDLGPEDHLVMILSSRALLSDRRGLRCRLSLAMREPPAIQSRYYRMVPWIAARFHRLLTHNSGILEKCVNARFLPHGSTWLKPPFPDPPVKDQGVAMIASARRSTRGQRLRHRIASWSAVSYPDLRLFGRGYHPLVCKTVGHLPYRYSVVIENSRSCGYFTEKLIDCLLCYSIPIYWGAPDVGHFFDTRGIVACSTESELRDAILGVKEAEYAARLPYLLENRERALQYLHYRRTASGLLMDEDALGSFRASA